MSGRLCEFHGLANEAYAKLLPWRWHHRRDEVQTPRLAISCQLAWDSWSVPSSCNPKGDSPVATLWSSRLSFDSNISLDLLHCHSHTTLRVEPDDFLHSLSRKAWEVAFGLFGSAILHSWAPNNENAGLPDLRYLPWWAREFESESVCYWQAGPSRHSHRDDAGDRLQANGCLALPKHFSLLYLLFEYYVILLLI